MARKSARYGILVYALGTEIELEDGSKKPYIISMHPYFDREDKKTASASLMEALELFKQNYGPEVFQRLHVVGDSAFSTKGMRDYCVNNGTHLVYHISYSLFTNL